jgi:signal transduction histidine kinase
VVDDGVGLGSSTRRSGLDNLRQRAERRDGQMTVTSSPEEGTQLQWQIALS